MEKLDEQKQKNKPVIVFALITSIISWIDSMNWLGSNGNIPMNNNYAKQGIRPFTLDRKFLF